MFCNFVFEVCCFYLVGLASMTELQKWSAGTNAASYAFRLGSLHDPIVKNKGHDSAGFVVSSPNSLKVHNACFLVEAVGAPYVSMACQ